MAKIDVPIKRLMQTRIEDWIEFLIPNCNKDWIKEMDPTKVPAKKESRLDKLIGTVAIINEFLDSGGVLTPSEDFRSRHLGA